MNRRELRPEDRRVVNGAISRSHAIIGLAESVNIQSEKDPKLPVYHLRRNRERPNGLVSQEVIQMLIKQVLELDNFYQQNMLTERQLCYVSQLPYSPQNIAIIKQVLGISAEEDSQN